MALARGAIYMKPETLEKILSHQMKKGDVLSVAQIGGIMGCKRTSELIPMCHNIPITASDIRFEPDAENSCIHIEAELKTTGKTGIEIEALTAVSVAALTIYDMCKAVDRDMVIGDIKLMKRPGATLAPLREKRRNDDKRKSDRHQPQRKKGRDENARGRRRVY